MAYDLLVGKGKRAKEGREFAGSIEFDELPAISRLLKRRDSSFLYRVSTFFEDQTFSLEEIAQAQAQLLPLMLLKLGDDERAMLHKLIAVLTYAQSKQLGLYGIAD